MNRTRKNNSRLWLMIQTALLAVVLIVGVVISAQLSNLGQTDAPDETQIHLESQPTEGTAGTEATDPTDPANPTDPSDPTDPTDPSDPTDPTEPSEPEEPEPTWMELPADRQLASKKAFVYDCATDSMEYLKGSATDKLYPASITKLMTAYVALQYLPFDQQITAGDILDKVAWGSSVAQIKKGDTLTVEELVTGLLLPSGNDASYILAEAAAKKIENDDSVSGTNAINIFMDEVNRQLTVLGMTNTHFTNPDGIHSSNHYTTMADLVILAKTALQNETIMRCVQTVSMNMTLGGKEVLWENTNQLINPESEYYCPIAIGLKTGNTPYAGNCLLTAFEYKGHIWIAGVFDSDSDNDDLRFEDTLQIFTPVFKETK